MLLPFVGCLQKPFFLEINLFKARILPNFAHFGFQTETKIFFDKFFVTQNIAHFDL